MCILSLNMMKSCNTFILLLNSGEFLTSLPAKQSTGARCRVQQLYFYSIHDRRCSQSSRRHTAGCASYWWKGAFARATRDLCKALPVKSSTAFCQVARSTDVQVSFWRSALLKLLRDHKPHFNKENTHTQRREIPPQLKASHLPALSTSHAELQPCI